jgi:hypothetical protein
MHVSVSHCLPLSFLKARPAAYATLNIHNKDTRLHTSQQ